MGREDEIAVLDVSPDGRKLRAITGASPSRLSSSHESGSRDRQLLDSDGCVTLAAAAALLKGLPHALMERRRHRSSVGGGGGEGPHGLVLPPSWMPELAVPESLMLAVYPGG